VLVLSRRVGEQIVIGDDIVVTVVDVRNDTVRLGIAAPRSVTVNRAEVRRAVEDANREASAADDSALDSLRALTARRDPAAKRPAQE
jgi:carbon storage regulator